MYTHNASTQITVEILCVHARVLQVHKKHLKLNTSCVLRVFNYNELFALNEESTSTWTAFGVTLAAIKNYHGTSSIKESDQSKKNLLYTMIMFFHY